VEILEDTQKNNPLKNWNTFHAEAGKVLGDEFWQDFADIIPKTGPRIDIYYTSNTVVVIAEIPGLNQPDQIGINLKGQTLVIEGDIPRPYPATENQIVQKERYFGSFSRSLPMPKPVSEKGIRAKYSQGLLIIELQCEQQIQSTKIQVDFE
jgi:HSP20 family protein